MKRFVQFEKPIDASQSFHEDEEELAGEDDQDEGAD